MNQMKQIQVSKVTVNVGIGQVGDEVEKAVRLLEKLTDGNPIKTESGQSAAGFGVRDGLNIGAKVTLRGEEAEEFLEMVFQALEEDLSITNFDRQGNFAFGIEEYINIPGVDYDPDIGMMGFDVAVTLERPGYRIKKRKEDTKTIGKDHLIDRDEAANFVQDTFDINIDGA